MFLTPRNQDSSRARSKPGKDSFPLRARVVNQEEGTESGPVIHPREEERRNRARFNTREKRKDGIGPGYPGAGSRTESGPVTQGPG